MLPLDSDVQYIKARRLELEVGLSRIRDRITLGKVQTETHEQVGADSRHGGAAAAVMTGNTEAARSSSKKGQHVSVSAAKALPVSASTR